MRVLFVTPMHAAFHAGGLGSSCARISTGLAKAGHIVSVAVFDSGSQQLDATKNPIGPVEQLHGDVLLHYFPPFDSITSAQSDAPILPPVDLHNTSIRLRVLIEKYRPAVIVAFYPVPLALPISVIAQQYSIPVVLAFRGSDVARSVYEPGALAILSAALRTAAACIFAASDLHSLAAAIAAPLPPSRVIYNGIEPDILDRAWSTNGRQAPIFGSIGIFKPVKGIEIFLRAIETLAMEERAILVGDFAKTTSDRTQFRIRVTGLVPRSTSLDLLDDMDVFVAPSLSEGCPNAVLEAMAAGKAILCSRVGAMRDLLEQRQSAIFLDDWSETSMREAMLELDGNASLRQELGQRSREIARTLTLAREIGEWNELLQETAR